MSDHEPKLSAELRVLLCQIFALGFIDAMAGFEVQEDDLISGVDPSAIEAIAIDCIAKGEDIIHANYIENPQMVHDEVYQVGRLVYGELERRHIQRN